MHKVILSTIAVLLGVIVMFGNFHSGASMLPDEGTVTSDAPAKEFVLRYTRDIQLSDGTVLRFEASPMGDAVERTILKNGRPVRKDMFLFSSRAADYDSTYQMPL